MLALTALVEYLHVAGAILWVGGQALLYLGVYPAVLEGKPAAALLAGLARRAGPVLGIAALAAIVFGLLRGTVFGAVWSFGDLVGTAYGRFFAAAIVLALALGAHGDVVRRRLLPALEAGGDPAAKAFLGRHTLVFLALSAVLLLLMIAMSLRL